MEKTAVDISLTENTDTGIMARLLLAACLCVAVTDEQCALERSFIDR